MIPCQCCKREFAPTWPWYTCDRCGFRICPECLVRHTGPYGTGGYKCSQCAFGYLKELI